MSKQNIEALIALLESNIRNEEGKYSKEDIANLKDGVELLKRYKKSQLVTILKAAVIKIFSAFVVHETAKYLPFSEWIEELFPKKDD